MVSDSTIEVLLIEDNPYDLELTLHTLKLPNVANDVHVARDGVEALEFLFGSDPDSDTGIKPRMILLDLKLPRLDGLEVLRRLRSDKRTKMIPVVVLTSSREEQDIIESYNLGVNSYIVKPVDFQQFTEAIRTMGLYWLILNEPPIIRRISE